MHPDDLTDATFISAFKVPPELDPATVALVVEAHARLVGSTAARKILGDLVETGGAADLADLPVVIAADSNLVEMVTSGDTDLAALGQICCVLEEEGWQVVALVPLGRLGSAHTLCRSSGIVRLQPYWRYGDSIAFGSPEIP